MRRLRICLVITEDWYFWSHRRSLAQYLIAAGHEVHLVTRLSHLESEIQAAGITPHRVGLRRATRNPLREGQVCWRMAGLFQRLQPDVVHLVGMKPILYGSIAARRAGVPATVCAIAGLGWLFTPGGILKSAAREIFTRYFRVALANRSGVGFLVQNSHHREVLERRRMAGAQQTTIVAGAGVDPNRFRFLPEQQSTPTILTHARMLWDKGIGDLVAAARIMQRQNVGCQIRLVGDPDPANPASIPVEQLQAWNQEGIVQWESRRNDIPNLLAQAHIACLPSYHEGFPLSLVEALACGRPVVTNDIPGCRDAVQHNVTGLLVEKQNSQALAAALTQLVESSALRQQMGQRGHQDVLRRMTSQIVNQQTLACYEQLLDGETVSRSLRKAA